MVKPKIGLITYHYPHLKTEQVLLRLLDSLDANYQVYALPFKARKSRSPLIVHRPNQTNAVATEVLAKKHQIPYKVCLSDLDIDNACDYYLVLGAGILSAECVEGKKIINCHPGIIPAARGLDAFKWTILNRQPLGITLHYIDKEVDAGEIISVIPTHVYSTDTLETLARRHYESEINFTANFKQYLENPVNPFKDIDSTEPRMRMPMSMERELQSTFSDYLNLYGQGFHGVNAA